MPVIVAVLGLLAVFGRQGLLNRGLEALGLPAIPVFGPQGVILAHVFLNLPFAVRLLLQGWATIPAERFRLAASLGFGPGEIARYLERPMLREMLPGAALAVFLICLSSFTVALVLGGGPRATTLELAIYQAFRFDFDLARAATLGAMQVAVCAAVTVASLSVALPSGVGAGLDRAVERWDAARPLLRIQDGALILFAALFLLVPLAAIILSGLSALGDLPESVWRAALRSTVMAVISAAISVLGALAIAIAAARIALGRGRALEALGMSALAVSPLVIGTGLFLVMRPVADPVALALPVTVAVNAVMALPFALRSLAPAARAVEADYGRLADSLGMTGAARLRLLTLPRLRAPIGFAAGLSAALAMGDLGVVTLFADPERGTLPLALYQLMGAYRMDAAAGAAVLLLALSLALFWLFDRGGQADAAA